MNNNTSNSNKPSENSNILSYYYIGLSFGFIILVMIIALFTIYCNRRNWQDSLQSRAGGNTSNSNRTLIFMDTDHTEVNIEISEEDQDTILNSYPMLLYSQAKLHKPESTSLHCSICLADYKDSEWLRLLPDCGHFFHKDCIGTWFRLNFSCPVCRNSPLPTPLAEVTSLANTHN